MALERLLRLMRSSDEEDILKDVDELIDMMLDYADLVAERTEESLLKANDLRNEIKRKLYEIGDKYDVLVTDGLKRRLQIIEERLDLLQQKVEKLIEIVGSG